MLKIKKTDNPIAIRSQRLICESFKKIMYEKPYEKITITEVCKNANLVRETFYRNFSSKEAIVKHILDSKFDELSNFRHNNNQGEIEDFFIDYFTYWKEEKEFIIFLIDNHLFSIMINQTMDLICIKIDKIIGKEESEQTKNYIASLYAGAINNLLFSWVKNDFEETPKEMARIIKSYSMFLKK